jgi:outer membrane protein assembly factor BamB
MTNTQSKTFAVAFSLFLMISMAVSIVTLPNVNAQALIMNVTDKVLIHSEVDIDLNGGPGPFENVSLFIKYPGRADFTYIGTYETRSNGDLDVYDFDFNETGDFELKWSLPPEHIVDSNVATVEVVLEILRTSFPYIGATPNPVGVGQETLLHLGITQQHSGGVGYGWEGLTVTVTRPDGHTETLGPFMTDSTGGTGTVYVPTMAGNYTLQTNYPTQLWRGITYTESHSPPLTLVVTEEPIEFYPTHPLPTEYWTRPIDPQLRSWNVVAGSWLVFTPENKFAVGNDGAPDTAHVLWNKVLTTGGLVGEELGEHSFEIGDAYEGKWTSRFIVAGKLYYNKYSSPEGTNEGVEYVCVDLHTGEELWSKVFMNNRSISFGQLHYWDSYDYHGTYDYLWITSGRTYYAFDAFTGDWVYTMENVPSGDRVTGPKGEILIYTIDRSGGYMTLWNSSNLPRLYASTSYASMQWGQWRPYGKTIDAQEPMNRPTTPLGISGYEWNVSIPTDLPGGDLAWWHNDRVVGGTISQEEVSLWGLNLDPEKGAIGQELFRNTWSAPAYWKDDEVTVSGFDGGWMAFGQEEKVAVLWVKETREHYGFSLETGQNLCGPTEPQYYLDSVDDSASDVRLIAYDKFYCASVSGIVYCYDAQTGERLWTYEATDVYSEILWANTWWLKPLFICDGKIYLGHAEHSPIDPRPRGAPFICLNATTGEEIWRVDGMFRQTRWGGRGIIGDSIIATMDTYDQRIWAVGRGPSATTVTAPDVGLELGKKALVKGMVTDVSPGTNSAGLEMRFPNGVPAVSDADMSEWMLYVYKQFERPADVMGVEVVVSVVDPNNNSYEVGRTTSDASGFFTMSFVPEVPGDYLVIGSFEGSGAYYGSYAETSLTVEEAPTATPEPTPTPAPMTDTYVLGLGAGAIIAIVVIGLILILMMRKR